MDLNTNDVTKAYDGEKGIGQDVWGRGEYSLC